MKFTNTILTTLAVLVVTLFACKKQEEVTTSQLERPQTYYTKVKFDNPIWGVDSVRWVPVYYQYADDPLTVSFTIIPGREATGFLKVTSWELFVDGVSVKKSSTKKDFTYPQVIPVDIPETGIPTPYNGDPTKTFHSVSVYVTHSNAGDYSDGVYFYE